MHGRFKQFKQSPNGRCITTFTIPHCIISNTTQNERNIFITNPWCRMGVLKIQGERIMMISPVVLGNYTNVVQTSISLCNRNWLRPWYHFNAGNDVPNSKPLRWTLFHCQMTAATDDSARPKKYPSSWLASDGLIQRIASVWSTDSPLTSCDITEVLALFLWRRLGRRLRHSWVSTQKSVHLLMALLSWDFVGFSIEFFAYRNIWDPYSLSLKVAHAHLPHDDSCKFNETNIHGDQLIS